MAELLARYIFHWLPEKAIWLGGQTLSWDARCAGIYAGFGIALLFHLLYRRHQCTLPSWTLLATAAVLSLPLFVDVTTIHYALRPPDNTIRHLTGVLFGISFCSLLYPAVALLAGRQADSSDRLTPARLLMLAVAGAAVSLLTRYDHPFSFYLLESLAWTGFIGLAGLICRGILNLRS